MTIEQLPGDPVNNDSENIPSPGLIEVPEISHDEPVVDKSEPVKVSGRQVSNEELEEELGIKPIEKSKDEQDMDNWRKMSVEKPLEPIKELLAKAKKIADPGLRRRTERYVVANRYYEEGDIIWHESEKLLKIGKAQEAQALKPKYEALYEKAKKEYDEADTEYADYQHEERRKKIVEATRAPMDPKNRNFLSKGLSKISKITGGLGKIGGWFRKKK